MNKATPTMPIPPLEMPHDEILMSREKIAYIKLVRSMILTDARVLFSSFNYKSKIDIYTASHLGKFQASIIVYPDLGTDTRWVPLGEGIWCQDLPAAMTRLWEAVQMKLGETKVTQQEQAFAQQARLMAMWFEEQEIKKRGRKDSPGDSGMEDGDGSEEGWVVNDDESDESDEGIVVEGEDIRDRFS